MYNFKENFNVNRYSNNNLNNNNDENNTNYAPISKNIFIKIIKRIKNIIIIIPLELGKIY